jgi:hypothetical protein
LCASSGVIDSTSSPRIRRALSTADAASSCPAVCNAGLESTRAAVCRTLARSRAKSHQAGTVVGIAKQMLKLLPLEPTFNEFVQSVGGELLEKLLPNNDGRKRADYLFRSPLIIAELKCIEHDINIAEYRSKLLALMRRWQAEGFRAYGTVRVELRKLPKRWQAEWMDLHEKPIQKILKRSNKQIRDAKKSLGLFDAKGVILIANEGQMFSSPADLFTYIARILQKTKPDGELIYSSIHHVALFSTSIPVFSPSLPQPVLPWFPAFRGRPIQRPARSWQN